MTNAGAQMISNRKYLFLRFTDINEIFFRSLDDVIRVRIIGLFYHNSCLTHQINPPGDEDFRYRWNEGS